MVVLTPVAVTRFEELMTTQYSDFHNHGVRPTLHKNPYFVRFRSKYSYHYDISSLPGTRIRVYKENQCKTLTSSGQKCVINPLSKLHVTLISNTKNH